VSPAELNFRVSYDLTKHDGELLRTGTGGALQLRLLIVCPSKYNNPQRVKKQNVPNHTAEASVQEPFSRPSYVHVCSLWQVARLLRLDQANPTGSPLVHYSNLSILLVLEDVEVVIDVLQAKDSLFY